MECKHCGAALNEEAQTCPECGADTDLRTTAAEETVAETAEAVGESCADETSAEEPAAEAQAEAGEAREKTPESGKNTGLIVALVACLAAIAVLLVLLFGGSKEQPAGDEPPIIPPEEQSGETAPAQDPQADATGTESDLFEENLITPYVPAVSYVKDDPAAFDAELLAAVVASCGDSELTNELLTYYYWREYFTFANMYSSYLSMLMDPYGRLDEQEAITGGQSWDEMFMEFCITSYHTYAAAATAGREAGYEMSQSEIEGLENTTAELDSYAELYGYETADEYLQLSFGPYASAEGYKAFMAEYLYGASYLEHLLQEKGITADEVNAYYEEHKEEMIASGLEKDDRSMVNIRHILIMPATVELAADEEGYEQAVADALADAKAEAEAIYAEWQAGEMTEESFSALAMEHSADGSAANGGLIEGISPGQTVENFDAWCFAEGRKAGDHGLVETEFGYHIIFLSAVQEESLWYQTVRAEYENEIYMDICREISDRYPLTTDLSKAAVYPVNVEILNNAQ